MILPKPLTQPLPYGNRPTGSVRASAQPWWAWVMVLVPVLVFAGVWQYYAVNVPKWDDHALREYLYRFDQETSFRGKIYQLFKQHNEHRIVFDRIITTLDYWLFGKLSYVHLMVVGNLSLVGLLAVFGTVLLRAGKSLIHAVPVALLLFNLSHWENMFWGMAALQNFSVVLWVVLTVYLLSYRKHSGLAMATAILATLTSGNGLLVWPIGLILLALRLGTDKPYTGRRSRFQSGPLIGWAVGAAVVIGLYFVGFEKPAGNPPLRGMAADLLKGWLAFTGAAAEVLSVSSPLRMTALLGGLLVLATVGSVGWSLWTYWPSISSAVRNVFKPGTAGASAKRPLPPVVLLLWGCAAFILGTGAIVAWTRTGFGLDLIFTSRYKIYSLTLLALLYVYTVAVLPPYAGRWVGVAGGIGSLLMAWLSYNAYADETIWWRHWMLTSQFNGTHGTNQSGSQVDAVTKQYTTLAPAFYDANPAILYSAGQAAVMPVTVTKRPAGFEVRQATLPAQDRRDGRSFMVARSPNRTYLFPTRQNQLINKRTRFWPADSFTAGFTATIAPIDLDAGTYQLFLLTVAVDGSLTLFPTGQTITSVGQLIAPLKKNW